VASSTCQTCNQTTLVLPQYDGSKPSFTFGESTTLQPTTRTANLSYADGSGVVGLVVSDTVGLGTYTVPNQTFVLATQETVDFGVAGILGLAFPALSRTGSNPWWLNALDQFEQPEMSFFFTEWVSHLSIYTS
jgi:cathepsin D